jgi:NAD(P)-dependent dehydrogenase (short-subunit alcohol dehydrogenase family)
MDVMRPDVASAVAKSNASRLHPHSGQQRRRGDNQRLGVRGGVVRRRGRPRRGLACDAVGGAARQEHGQGGSIINIASITGLPSAAAISSYVASRGPGSVQLTKAMGWSWHATTSA